jgi:tellurite resistance protein
MLPRVLAQTVLSHGLPRAVARIPGLKRLPVLKLVAVAELALVARRHLQHLDAAERRRLAELVRHGRGLSEAEREELRRLVAKLDARAFAGAAVKRLSPVPLPSRLTRARY